jgi:predicted NAD/FAD-dependent oxidoreductase
VLRDSLGARASDADFVLPVRTLSQLLPEPAQRWLGERGATLELRSTVRELSVRDERWIIGSSREDWQASRVVLALPPFAAARLLANVARDCAPRLALLAQLERYDYDSIVTVYLAWPAAQAPSLPSWIMLEEDAGRGAWGQWLFDRGSRDGLRIASVVVSARARLGDVAPAELAAGIARQVADQLGTAAPVDARSVVEKRATFRCTPDRPRLRPDSFAELAPGGGVLARLALAGDYAEPDYPATLESAVRSGVEAARLLMG